MKKILSIIFLIFLFNQSKAQTLEWIRNFGDATPESLQAIAVDADGNCYVSGASNSFNPLDINPSNNPDDTFFVFNSNIGFAGGFVMRLDPNGNFIWGLELDSAYAGGTDAAIDAQQNLILIAGGSKTFIYKINSTNGDIISKKSIDVVFSSFYPTKLNISSQGNILLGGLFRDTVDFDPGPNVFNLKTDEVSGSLFILKLDNNFNFIWVKEFKTIGSESAMGYIASDANENIYATGYFQDNLDFDPSAAEYILSAEAVSDIYVFKIDVDGNFVWAKQFTTGPSGNGYNRGNAIAVNATGDIVVGGDFGNGSYSIIDFDLSSGTSNLESFGYNAFLLKLNTNGEFIWVKQISNFDGCSSGINSLKIDNGNNIICSGIFNETQDFDPGNGTLNLIAGTNNILFDAFVMKVFPDGTLNWAQHVGKANNNDSEIQTFDLDINTSGEIYCAGMLKGATKTDTSFQITDVTAAGFNFDAFLFKIGDLTAGIQSFNTSKGLVRVYPNPTTSIVNIDFKTESKKIEIDLYNLLGKKLFHQNINSTNYQLDLSAFPSGTYFISVKTEKENIFQKIVKQ